MATVSNTEQKRTFDYVMLKILLVDFLRNTNLSFSTADNKKFQTILEYLRPDLAFLPTSSELIKLNIEESSAFQCWEHLEKTLNSDVTASRIDLANKLIAKQRCGEPVAMLRSEDKPDLSPYSSNTCYSLQTVAPGIEEDGNGPFVDRDIKSEPMYENEYGYEQMVHESKPDWSAYMPSSTIETEYKTEPCFTPLNSYRGNNVGSQDYQIGESSCNVQPEEFYDEPMKSSSNASQLSRSDAGQDVKSEAFLLSFNDLLQYTDSLASSEQITQNDVIMRPNIAFHKRRHTKTDMLLAFKHIPGIASWPCIVCHERLEPSKIRSINNNDAYIMIYVCVAKNTYTLEIAKTIAILQKFKCCVCHLDELYDSAVQLLGITNPEKDVTTDNLKIVEAYNVIKAIKDTRYPPKLLHDGSRKHIAPFCRSVRSFLATYGRPKPKPATIKNRIHEKP
ncbi:unnamed protein product [Caenorhabditis sp. 36 PRJEB53466]|nr:unnamed protein product [Caenorhabditis sp. 36 PRJEB53466]